jgi:hypothetical protein
VALALAFTATGCIASELQRAGAGVLDSLHARRGAVGAVAATLAESATTGVSRGLHDSLQPRMDSALVALLLRLRAHTDTLTDSLEGGLAAFIRTGLDSALDQLLTHRTRQVRASVTAAVPEWIGALGANTRTTLAPAIGEAADSAGTRLVRAVDAGLQGRLRPTLMALVQEVAESVRVSAGRTTTPILKRVSGIVWLVAGMVLTVVAGVVIVAWLRYRQTQRSLDAVATAVNKQGTADLKRAIKQEATDRQVEPWLHAYLTKRGLL